MDFVTATFSSRPYRRPLPSARGGPRRVGRSERRTILVVDDDPSIGELLGHALADDGFDVRIARDGNAALDAINERPPDLVISDIMMPKLGGIGLAARLRERGLDVPVVLISAAYQDVDIPDVRFLTKPFDLDHLIAVVGQSLSGRSPS